MHITLWRESLACEPPGTQGSCGHGGAGLKRNHPRTAPARSTDHAANGGRERRARAPGSADPGRSGATGSRRSRPSAAAARRTGPSACTGPRCRCRDGLACLRAAPTTIGGLHDDASGTLRSADRAHEMGTGVIDTGNNYIILLMGYLACRRKALVSPLSEAEVTLSPMMPMSARGGRGAGPGRHRSTVCREIAGRLRRGASPVSVCHETICAQACRSGGLRGIFGEDMSGDPFRPVAFRHHAGVSVPPRAHGSRAALRPGGMLRGVSDQAGAPLW